MFADSFHFKSLGECTHEVPHFTTIRGFFRSHPGVLLFQAIIQTSILVCESDMVLAVSGVVEVVQREPPWTLLPGRLFLRVV